MRNAVWDCLTVYQQGLTAKEVISKVRELTAWKISMPLNISRIQIVAVWFPIWVFVACGFDHGA